MEGCAEFKSYQEYGVHLAKKKNEINSLESEIDNYESDTNKNLYFLDLAEIYFKYDNTSEDNTESHSIMNNLVTVTKKINKEKFFDVYMRKIALLNPEEEYTYEHSKFIDDECRDCKTKNDFDKCDGFLVCKICGTVKDILADSSKPSFKDKNTDIKPYPFSYKKLNHFNEWLCQIQGLEVTKISKEIFDKLRNEIKKERIDDNKQITQKKVREYLKKLKLNKYYEHVPFITLQLDGEAPPIIPENVQNELRKLFVEISAPFITYCPKLRRNFPRYTYIIYKSCEMIGYKVLLPYLPLLKTRSRLIEMDKIWKKICETFNFTFIPTV